MSKRCWILVGILLSPVASAGQGQGESSGPGEGANGWSSTSGTLRVGGQDELSTLNPLTAVDMWSENLLDQLFDPFARHDWRNRTTQPWIALDWCYESKSSPGACATSAADDDLRNATVTYKIGDWKNRWGGPVTFHDGVEATLDDVVFSYALAASAPLRLDSVRHLVWNQSQGYGWSNPPYGDPSFVKMKIGGEESWLGVLKSGQHTIQFKLARPYGGFANDTLAVTLFPKHVWTPHIDVQNGTGDFLSWDMGFNATSGLAPGLVGSGAFRFDRWMVAQYARILRYDSLFNWTSLPTVDSRGRQIDTSDPCANCAYDPAWTERLHRARLDAVELRLYLTTDAAALALKQNQIDLMAWPITPSMVSDLQNGTNCKDQSGNTVNCGTVIGLVNSADRGPVQVGYNQRQQPFSFAPLRRALNHLIDRPTIISQVLQGYGVEAGGPVSPASSPWHNGSLAVIGFDEALAGSILDSAGWIRDTTCPQIGNPPGYARRLPGTGCGQFAMQVTEAAYDPVQAVAGQMLEAAATKAGVNLKAAPTAQKQIVSNLKSGIFQMYMMSWRIAPDPPEDLRGRQSCLNSPAGMNYDGYCDSEFTSISGALDGASNFTMRIQLAKDLQGNLAGSPAANYVLHRLVVEAFRKDRFLVEGTSPPSLVREPTGIVNKWSFQLMKPASPAVPEVGFSLLTLSVTTVAVCMAVFWRSTDRWSRKYQLLLEWLQR